LGRRVAGLRRARVQAAELEARAEHVRDELEHRRLEQALDEHVALVREVREPRRSRLGPELRARVLAFRSEQRVDPTHDEVEPRRAQHAFERRVAALVELEAMARAVLHAPDPTRGRYRLTG